MNYWKISTFVLSGCLGLGLIYETATPAHAEAQPVMQEAIAALRVAQAKLQRSANSKGGHKARAYNHTVEAIQELEAGIAYDEAHKNDKP